MQQISRLDRFADLCKQFRGRFLVNKNDGCNITDERNARSSMKSASGRRHFRLERLKPKSLHRAVSLMAANTAALASSTLALGLLLK